MMRKKIAVVLIFSILMSSCAASYGGKVFLNSENLQYPVSFTPYMERGDQIVYYKNENDKFGLKKVKRFSYTFTASVPQRGLGKSIHLNLARILNRKIREAGGDGMVNFAIKNVGSAPINFSSELPHLYYRGMFLLGSSVLLLDKIFANRQPFPSEDQNEWSGPLMVLAILGGTLLGAYYLKWLPSTIKVQFEGDIVKFE